MRKVARFAQPLTTLFIVAFAAMLASSLLAAPVPSQPVAAGNETRDQLTARAEKVLNAQAVSDALKKVGLSEKQISSRLNKLSNAELKLVASGGEQVQVAGAGSESTPSTTTWLIVIVIILLLVS